MDIEHKPKIYLIHGFNVWDGGKNSIDKLALPLRRFGYEVDTTTLDYGWFGLISVRLFNRKVVSKLISIVREEDIVIAHSNGCAIIAKAIDKGAKVHKAIFIHPALNKKWKPHFYARIKKILVFYSPRDKATWISKFLLLHTWGEMGTTGPTNKHRVFEAIDDNMKHSQGFSDALEVYTKHINRIINGK